MCQKFYEYTFNWLTNPIPELNYTILTTTEVDDKNLPKEPGAINGGLLQRGNKKNFLLAIRVENIDEALKKVASLGGKVRRGKMAVPKMGLPAYFQDTKGNVLGLW